jgi:hypothetical protein
MKRCKNINCWTDYPILDLGDISGKPAPFRQVIVRSYDGDKRCLCVVKQTLSAYLMGIPEILVEIKTGYLYSNTSAKLVNRRKFERMINSD